MNQEGPPLLTDEDARLPLDISVPMAVSQSRRTQMAIEGSQLGSCAGGASSHSVISAHPSEIVALPAADAP